MNIWYHILQPLNVNTYLEIPLHQTFFNTFNSHDLPWPDPFFRYSISIDL